MQPPDTIALQSEIEACRLCVQYGATYRLAGNRGDQHCPDHAEALKALKALEATDV